jgi:DNA polymerase-3 subunit alpha
MEIAKILAGYSLAEADLLRRAMGKKIKEEMDKQKEFFINGAMKNGLEPSKADYIFELVAKFAGYGFNKSHATAYAIISYYTAWLKTHYKLEFFTALFNLEIQNTDKLGVLKADAGAHGVKILPPCVLRSGIYFLIEKEADCEEESIRYGLYAIKNLGEFVSKSITDSREKHGDFKNLFEFLRRFNNKVLNKKSLESLIKSGALDALIQKTNSGLGLCLNRSSLLASVLNLIEFINKNQEFSGQKSLFSFDSDDCEEDDSFERPDIEILKDLSESEMATGEFEAIGFYLTNNPVNSYRNFLKKNNIVSCADSASLGSNQTIYMAGAVSGIHIRSSKRGKFANLTMVDDSGMSELFIYDGKMIEENAEILKPGNLIFIHVKGLGEKNKNSFENSGGSVRLIIQTLSDLRKIAVSSKSIFELEFDDSLIHFFDREFELSDSFLGAKIIERLSSKLGSFYEISEFAQEGGVVSFPNFNTYYIFKIFSLKFRCLIEIKPNLVFKDHDDFAALESELKEINGFKALKKVF